jgi:hypothetical protein
MPRSESSSAKKKAGDNKTTTKTKSSTTTNNNNKIGPPSRYSYEATQLHNKEFFKNDAQEEDDQELVELERRLNEEVDEEFFDEPRKFHTLQRVIDVLGLQMMDDAAAMTTTTTLRGDDRNNKNVQELSKNPAYRNLKQQQEIVEGAIEHMAVIHCADLNGSVIQVGRVARQFSEAVSKVRTLRKQVRDIQDTLGASTQANSQVAVKGGGATGLGNRTHSQNAAAMSLRELWLKKLECEATLAVLEKLDVIRAAPYRFDQLIRPPCRIGAAVLTLSNALETMFLDDVAQIQALHKVRFIANSLGCICCACVISIQGSYKHTHSLTRYNPSHRLWSNSCYESKRRRKLFGTL